MATTHKANARARAFMEASRDSARTKRETNKRVAAENPLYAQKLRKQERDEKAQRSEYVQKHSVPKTADQATASKGRGGKKYITVEDQAHGRKEVREHASKKDAHAYGMERRRAGGVIFAHSEADAAKHGLDPRKAAAKGIQKHARMAQRELVGSADYTKERKALGDARKDLHKSTGGRTVGKAGMRAKPPALQRGKKGGAFYLGDHGQKIYVGKK